MDLGLNGRTALVLGAGGGLGRAIARTLAEEGAKLALVDIDAEALDVTRAELDARGATCLSLAWNLADIGAAAAHVAAIEAALGPVDVLVNNTGGPPPSPAQGVEPQVWEAQFRAMVLSVIHLTDCVVPGMRARKWGRIVTSTSSGVVAPIPNLAISNTLRSALVGWSKTLAREVAGDGVTANVILPGRIATARIRFLDEQKAKREGRPLEAIVAQSTGAIPVGRYGTPEEYADAVAFLASTRAAYITGSVIRVDGGYLQNI
ncbi:SDR family oxidoreductase [Ancylobacter amanitiformis]|uniref:3-oxoacyl-[acyl-carrier protein] reductase n=1 Tax=Ancylobacter amanitiformis TaxID=217069 RepID=A0ABU0LV12_9HYPH|nr:SDR family oxidoreductase [Ancylobacter amanitiformis]MDQ0512499.1 3-oxoacyl-[acyl-carrier protein] reductase [Ancylobacter amanitiformis]